MTLLTRPRRAVLAAFAMNGFAAASWVSRVPAFRDHFALSDAHLGLVLLSVSAGAVLALPTTGAVVARIGTTTTVRAGCLVTAVGLALMGLAPAVWMLVVGMVLTGVGSGSWDVAMNVEGAEVERLAGRSVMPRFHAAYSLGTVAGALLGVGLTAAHVPTAWHLVAVAVVVLAATQTAVAGFLPADTSSQAHPGGAAVFPRRPFAAWRETGVLAIGLLVLCFAFAEGTANDWLALGMVDGHRVPNAVGVAAFALFVSAMTAGRVFGTHLLDRHGRVVVLRATAGCAVAGVLLVVFGTLPLGMVGALMWGVGASLGFPIGMSAGGDEPAHAAARVSVVSSIGYTAFLAGPPFVGFLAQHVGVLHALLSVVVVLAAGAFLAPSCQTSARS